MNFQCTYIYDKISDDLSPFETWRRHALVFREYEVLSSGNLLSSSQVFCKWDAKRNDFLEQIYPIATCKRCTKLFNQEFGLQLDRKAIKNQAQVLRICDPKDKKIYKEGKFISVHRDIAIFFSYRSPRNTFEKSKKLFLKKFEYRLVDVTDLVVRSYIDLNRCLADWFCSFWTSSKDKLISELFLLLGKGIFPLSDCVICFNRTFSANLKARDLVSRYKVIQATLIQQEDDSANEVGQTESSPENIGLSCTEGASDFYISNLLQ